jgi:hypothetical protein
VKGKLAGLALCGLALAGCAGGAPSKAQQASTSEVPKGSLFVAIKVLKQGTQVLALVPVRINGKGPYSFALDTGASQSLVDSQVASELRVQKTGQRQRFAGDVELLLVRAVSDGQRYRGSVGDPPVVAALVRVPVGQ